MESVCIPGDCFTLQTSDSFKSAAERRLFFLSLLGTKMNLDRLQICKFSCLIRFQDILEHPAPCLQDVDIKCQGDFSEECSFNGLTVSQCLVLSARKCCLCQKMSVFNEIKKESAKRSDNHQNQRD